MQKQIINVKRKRIKIKNFTLALISLFSKTPEIKNKRLKNIYSWMKNIYRIKILKI